MLSFLNLGIRHAEELSVLRSSKIPTTNVSHERRTSPRRRRHNMGTLNRHNSMGDSLANNTSTVSTLFSPATPKLRSTTTINTTVNIFGIKILKKNFCLFSYKDSTMRHQRSMSNLSKSLNSLVTNTDGNLAQTPATPLKNALSQISKPVNIIEKSKLNGLWYDSSKSLMEQNTNENDLILLRFKYFTFYDINPKVLSINIRCLS